MRTWSGESSYTRPVVRTAASISATSVGSEVLPPVAGRRGRRRGPLYISSSRALAARLQRFLRENKVAGGRCFLPVRLLRSSGVTRRTALALFLADTGDRARRRPAAGAPQPTRTQVTVYATGLVNPKGMAFFDDSLYVAESGKPGKVDVPLPVNFGGKGPIGRNARVSRIDEGERKRLRHGPSEHRSLRRGRDARGGERHRSRQPALGGGRGPHDRLAGALGRRRGTGR